MPTRKKREQGRKNRAAGTRFEAKVRSEIEKMGWTVSKWMNTVDYEAKGKTGKLVPAKRKYNPFLKVLGIGVGFPDFICFKKVANGNYEVIGLEAKGNGYLDKVERGMCHWLIENRIFSRILVAKKGKKRGEIEFIEFKDKE
ncbi:hypothetical protein J4422_02875 [Candidatus Pacearchaeota archaeon]|nr:hypothetical protein [Candidatus Pacearchaeota archaeon]